MQQINQGLRGRVEEGNRMNKQDECTVCEGYFSYGEKIIEVNGERFCEACSKEAEE